MNTVNTTNEQGLPLQQKVKIMGILNMTPDSFSDGGQFIHIEHAIARAQTMIQEGADIIDIGGESTRPGATQVSLSEELQRVIPIIHELRKYSDIPISIDTYKSEVARQAMLAGATMVNDIWGGKADSRIWEIVKEFRCPYVLTHNRENASYSNLISDIVDDLRISVKQMIEAGVREDQIILDPGIGFAKNVEENLRLLHHLEQIVELGYPVLLGTSRKKFIRQTLNLPAHDVIEGTSATVAIGIYKGCSIIRVHDVSAMKRIVMMTEAILHSEKSN